MPQHDFVIDNAPGLAVRTDINVAFAAIQSSSSGPVAPAVTVAGQWWADTSDPANVVMNYRNNANTAWIQIAPDDPIMDAIRALGAPLTRLGVNAAGTNVQWVSGQPYKETRYLIAGTFVHTRDPANIRNVADVYVMGAQGGRPAAPWAATLICGAGGGGTGAVAIKRNYPLNPTANVVVGNGVSGAPGQASSFDATIVANGGANGTPGNGVSSSNFTWAGGAGGALPTTGDENYSGAPGNPMTMLAGWGVSLPATWITMREIQRSSAAPTASGTAATPAAAGMQGAIVVMEPLGW